MIKSWYLSVRDETMAPARMVSFMEQHVDTCPLCQQDPEVLGEIAKITEIILPESKIPKAVRQQNAAEDDEYDDDEIDDDDDDSGDDDNDDVDDEEEEEEEDLDEMDDDEIDEEDLDDF